MKFKCRLCDRETRTTNPSHKRVRIRNNTCKECMYIIGEFKPGMIWYA
jgi:hypothetical protein